EIGARRAQDLVDPPQLGVLPGQPPVLLDHVGAWPVVALAAVGLVLADPVAQGFGVHVQLLAQPPKRRAWGRLPIQPHRALAQLIGVLLRCCQQCLPSWLSRSNQSWKTPEKRGNLISRPTVSKWIGRYRAEGEAGLEDRSSRPHTSPTRTDPAVEAQIVALRKQERRGAVYLAGELGLVASTVGRVLARHQVPHLAAIDAITGEPVRRRHSGIRYERPRP